MLWKNYCISRKLRDVTENFRICPENVFWCQEKNFWWPPPPPLANNFGEKYECSVCLFGQTILCPPPQRLGPYAHGTNSERGIYLLTGIYTGISTDTNTVFCWYQIFCCILLIKYCILYVYWHKYCIQTLGGDSAVCRIYNHPDRSAQVLRNLDEYLIDTTDYLRNKYPDCGNVILGDFNNFDLHNLASNHIV
jgi:hypothetical protein